MFCHKAHRGEKQIGLLPVGRERCQEVQYRVTVRYMGGQHLI
jgi:hypothetical protein